MKKEIKAIPNPNLFGDKMRIKLVDPQTGALLSDRLVAQDTELRMGPKDIHKGPMSLEFNLNSQEDVDGMIAYIKKLKGELPIEKAEKKSSSSKKLDKMLSDKEPLLDLIKSVEAKAKNQEQLINMLREYNFMFVAADVIQDMATPEMITLKDNHLCYQFLVRRVKEAKEPANDKFDFRLVFGVKIVGERFEKVQVYLWGKWDHYIKMPWEKAKGINFKKVEKVYIFPDFMDYTDRRKWRSENRKKIKAEEKKTEFKPSKFYNKYSPYVKVH